jgi:hypothetical protein
MANVPAPSLSDAGTIKSIRALHYHCAKSADGDLVAVMCEEFPYSVIALHDFRTGQSWPHDYAYYNVGDIASRGTIRDARIREEHLRERLELDLPSISRQTLVRDRHYLVRQSSLDLSYSQVTDDDVAHLQGLEGFARWTFPVQDCQILVWSLSLPCRTLRILTYLIHK